MLNAAGFLNKFALELLGRLDYYRHPEWRDSWGGPFNGQAQRQEIAREIVTKLGIKAIVETGTYRGTTTKFLAKELNCSVHSVEHSPRNFGFASQNLIGTKNVTLYMNDSKSFLQDITSELTGCALFYLDAHWGAELPLANELAIIFSSRLSPIVMIDDFEVPGDSGYGFDDYGNGSVLNYAYIQPNCSKFGVTAFRPASSSAAETGAKRGCVILARSEDLVSQLRNCEHICEHTVA